MSKGQEKDKRWMLAALIAAVVLTAGWSGGGPHRCLCIQPPPPCGKSHC